MEVENKNLKNKNASIKEELTNSQINLSKLLIEKDSYASNFNKIKQDLTKKNELLFNCKCMAKDLKILNSNECAIELDNILDKEEAIMNTTASAKEKIKEEMQVITSIKITPKSNNKIAKMKNLLFKNKPLNHMNSNNNSTYRNSKNNSAKNSNKSNKNQQPNSNKNSDVSQKESKGLKKNNSESNLKYQTYNSDGSNNNNQEYYSDGKEYNSNGTDIEEYEINYYNNNDSYHDNLQIKNRLHRVTEDYKSNTSNNSGISGKKLNLPISTPKSMLKEYRKFKNFDNEADKKQNYNVQDESKNDGSIFETNNSHSLYYGKKKPNDDKDAYEHETDNSVKDILMDNDFNTINKKTSDIKKPAKNGKKEENDFDNYCYAQTNEVYTTLSQNFEKDLVQHKFSLFSTVSVIDDENEKDNSIIEQYQTVESINNNLSPNPYNKNKKTSTNHTQQSVNEYYEDDVDYNPL